MKTTGIYCIVLTLGTMLLSCNQVYFTKPLPADAPACSLVPAALQGSFTGIDLKNDTLIIDSTSLRLTSDEIRYTLGKDLVVKAQGEKYYINIKRDQWELGIASHLIGKTWQLETFAFDPEKDDAFIRTIKKIVLLKPTDSGNYVASPNERQFEKILREQPLYISLFDKDKSF